MAEHTVERTSSIVGAFEFLLLLFFTAAETAKLLCLSKLGLLTVSPVLTAHGLC